MSHPKPIKLTPVAVPKQWGGESILCNNEEFCGKILTFKAGAHFSCHLHVSKREVFWLRLGKLKLMTINTEDASQTEVIMSTGDVIEIPRLVPHQITALEDSEVIEFSTHHEDSDSLRVIAGDSQKAARKEVYVKTALEAIFGTPANPPLWSNLIFNERDEVISTGVAYEVTDESFARFPKRRDAWLKERASR